MGMIIGVYPLYTQLAHTLYLFLHFMFIHMLPTDRPYGLPRLSADKNPVAADEEVTFTCNDADIEALPKDYRYTFSREGESAQNLTSNTWSYEPGTVTSGTDHHCVISNSIGTWCTVIWAINIDNHRALPDGSQVFWIMYSCEHTDNTGLIN